MDARPASCHILDASPSVHSPPLCLPVVLLHGLGCSSEAWRPSLDLLAAALPRGEFRRLSGTAHALQYSRPREFVETALPFWAQAEDAAP